MCIPVLSPRETQVSAKLTGVQRDLLTQPGTPGFMVAPNADLALSHFLNTLPLTLFIYFILLFLFCSSQAKCRVSCALGQHTGWF